MVYATGGWARSTINIPASDDRHVSGWDIGGGYEYMISPNVIVGLEYIHVDYSDETFGLTGGDSVDVDADLDVVKARLTVRLARERW
jgi:outer membrane immunogenic protein